MTTTVQISIHALRKESDAGSATATR